MFCVVLNVLRRNFVVLRSFYCFDIKTDAIRCNLITFVVLCCVECFEHFGSFWSQIDAIHCNLINIVVLPPNSKFWSFLLQIDPIHYNLIIFVVLGFFDCFATKHNIFDRFDALTSNRCKLIVIWSRLFVVLRCFDRFTVKSMQSIVIWLLL